MIVCRTIPIFEVKVYLITSLSEAKAHVRENGSVEGEESVMDHWKGCCYTVTPKEGPQQRLMCVFDGDRNTVIHEAIHMAGLTLNHCGIKYSSTHDEALAYMGAWLAVEMLRLLDGVDPDK